MKKLYGTYRLEYLNDSTRRTISKRFKNENKDYVDLGLVFVKDQEINDSQYTKYLAPGVKSMTKFFRAEYNSDVISEGDFQIAKNRMINKNYAKFFDTPQEAITRIKDHTNLKEESTGLFVLQEEDVQNELERKTLTIN